MRLQENKMIRLVGPPQAKQTTYLCHSGRVSIVYANFILLATPPRVLNDAAACLTARDSTGCCQAHSNCNKEKKKKVISPNSLK